MTDQKTVNSNPAEKITPSGDLQVIAPSDTVDFENFSKGIILLDGDGTLNAIGSNGKVIAVTVGGLQTGVLYPFELQRVNATGTGATSMLVLF